VGGTLILMNKGLEKYVPVEIPVQAAQVEAEGLKVQDAHYAYKGREYMLVNALGSHQVPDGKYLYDSAAQKIEIQWVQGIGSDKAAAPQARLMATVINGILERQLPWRLVLLGVFLVLAVELLGIRSLPFAVGSYLSIATTMAIFAGGMVRWLAERGQKKKTDAETEVSPGSLYASGLIAAGGVFGLLAILINLLQDPEVGTRLPHWLSFLHLPIPADLFAFGPKVMPHLSQTQWLGVALFVLLASSLFFFARKKLE
jgi:OPT oligopeptide transporter protein